MQQLIRELSDSLAADRSGPTRKKWANYIIKNDIQLLDLVSILEAEHPVAMRFTWLLGEIITTKSRRSRIRSSILKVRKPIYI